ncbi:class E sortase [Streptomyces sp. NPDC056002]|uniref:class E sortase n=1 Tax=Streptomyces sp. NPDC056002 TaxID=3345675 RepID=UPI0035D9A22A
MRERKQWWRERQRRPVVVRQGPRAGRRMSGRRLSARAGRRAFGRRPSPPGRPQGPRPSALRRSLWTGAEVTVTLGVVLLLLVVHQLWWTNREARAGAERKVRALEREWAATPSDGRGDGGAGSASDPAGDGTPAGSSGGEGAGGGSARRGSAASAPRETPRWDQAYAVLTIPRLGLTVPVAEGVGKENVLNKGYVGHYPGTAQPGRPGNFALAGHRNTHGEPFRYINRLRKGDEVQVRTRGAVYTYIVDKTLAQTSARDGGVIKSVPRSEVVRGAGYSEPGYYVTLTTCTPEYTSRYRLAVWGKLRSMRPR